MAGLKSHQCLWGDSSSRTHRGSTGHSWCPLSRVGLWRSRLFWGPAEQSPPSETVTSAGSSPPGPSGLERALTSSCSVSCEDLVLIKDQQKGVTARTKSRQTLPTAEGVAFRPLRLKGSRVAWLLHKPTCQAFRDGALTSECAGPGERHSCETREDLSLPDRHRESAPTPGGPD